MQFLGGQPATYPGVAVRLTLSLFYSRHRFFLSSLRIQSRRKTTPQRMRTEGTDDAGGRSSSGIADEG
jgi:hypothetical protein